MPHDIIQDTSETLIGENSTYNLEEICEICGVQAEYIMELVEYGILTPASQQYQAWQFTLEHLTLSKKALRLQHDLGLNLPSVALTLELLMQRDELHNKLMLLQQRIKFFHVEID